MNILPFDKQVSAIAALTEGVSIRATERLTGIHRDTIMRLGVKIGQGCGRLHDQMMRDLHVPIIEIDEVWGYVGKKQRRSGAHPDLGDQYTYVALDATRKAIISYATGKRTVATTQTFTNDLAERVINAPQISSDGYEPYVEAIENAFGARVRYGQIVKHYRGEPGPTAARRYSPGYIVSVDTRDVFGQPERISTSYVERSNLSLRMACRRFTRLSNGFSKKLENHKAAVGLYVAHYNLCRVHETLRITPAMALGVTDHIWSIGELIEAALTSGAPAPTSGPTHTPRTERFVGHFRVIDGGKG